MSEAVKSRLISHVGMVVDDVDACMRFYADVMGFTRMYEATMDTGLELGGVALGDTLIEFIHGSPESPILAARGRVGAAKTHVGITVTQLDKALEVLERLGVVVFDGPREVGNATIAFALDPENRPVELIEFSGGEGRAMDFLGSS
jgi:catechol 2,3-dioxygenase-like lactoylglutathione lyase family enzyme